MEIHANAGVTHQNLFCTRVQMLNQMQIKLCKYTRSLLTSSFVTSALITLMTMMTMMTLMTTMPMMTLRTSMTVVTMMTLITTMKVI